MKTTLSLFLFLTFFLASYAQEKQILYFDQHDRQVGSVDEAYIIREIEKSVEHKVFTFKDFFKSNGKLKLTGSGYFHDDRIIYHGDFTVYNQNQLKIQEFGFECGRSKGPIKQYFDNGRLHKILQRLSFDYYDFDRAGADENELPNFGHHLFKLDYLADSTGKVLITNGNGHLVEQLNYLDENYVEEGDYVNGFREGIWKGRNFSGSKSYQETYKKGVLKRGKLLTADDGKISYSKLFTAPNYKYTNNHIAHLYLMDTDFYKRYVPGVKKTERGDYFIVVTLGINEKGNVDEVTFDRALTNEKVKADLTSALLNMPQWKPAVLRGQYTSAKYSCAIPFFKLME